MSRLFVDVQKLLQISIFSLRSCRLCSPLFVWVGVLLVYLVYQGEPSSAYLRSRSSPRSECTLSFAGVSTDVGGDDDLRNASSSLASGLLQNARLQQTWDIEKPRIETEANLL
jgi:hypothetical protein